MSVGELLPSNATAFEKAVGTGMTDVLPVPFRQILDPATAPERFLPFLAAHRSVDLWFGDWPVARKRQMIADAVKLARLKGMRIGSVAFLQFVDAALRAAIAYPEGYAVEAMPVGSAPIEPAPFLATYLVEIETVTPVGAYVPESEPVGLTFVGVPDEEPLRRALIAMRTAKAPETEIRADFQNWRPMRAGDRVAAGSSRRADHQIRLNRIEASL